MEPKAKKKKDSKEKTVNSQKFINVKPVLDEAVKDTVVVSWGRMNPVTSGHEKLAQKVASVAKERGATPMIFLSHSSDPKKNPLSYDDKVKFAQAAFGKIVMKSTAKTIIQVAAQLSKQFKNMVLVVGSDRVSEFNSLLNKYNGRDYKFSSIEVVSAGERDPDADDVSGMSASKMRALAVDNDLNTFKKGLPKKLQSKAKQVFDAVRDGMGIDEDINEGVKHDRYMRSHGKKASGSGGWFFTTKAMGEPSDDEVFSGNGRLSDVAKQAQKHFKTKDVYVMEEVELDEGKDGHPSLKANDRGAERAVHQYRQSNKDKLMSTKEEQSMTDNDWVVVAKGRKPARFLKNPKNNKAPRNWQKSPDEQEVIRVSKAKQMGIIKKEEVELDEGKDGVDQHPEVRKRFDAIGKTKPDSYERRRAVRAWTNKKKKELRNEENVCVLEGLDSEEMTLDEVMDMAQRRARAIVMKKHAKKIARARARSMKKKASKEKLIGRAEKQVKNALKDKFAKGRNYADLSMSQKQAIEKKIKKISAAKIKNMVKKKLPDVKQAEKERMSKKIDVEESSKYYTGVAKNKKDDREAHFARKAKMDDDNPKAYTPAPGDKEAKTKPSKYTKRFKQMYGEVTEASRKDQTVRKRPHMLMASKGGVKFDNRFKVYKAWKEKWAKQAAEFGKVVNESEMDIMDEIMNLAEDVEFIFESNPEKSLKDKAAKTGIAYGILKKVFDRGVAAWRTGHRPGTTPVQWGLARVNSFATGGKTRTTADADLWADHSGK